MIGRGKDTAIGALTYYLYVLVLQKRSSSIKEERRSCSPRPRVIGLRGAVRRDGEDGEVGIERRYLECRLEADGVAAAMTSSGRSRFRLFDVANGN